MRKTTVLAFILILFCSSAFGQDIKYKAVFIYNFIKHFEWPAEMQTGDFTIGVANDAEIYEELARICLGKNAGNQQIVVKKINQPTEAQNCHIFFIGSATSQNMKTNLSKIGNSPTLIITDKEGMAYKGAGVNFISKDNKITFEINKNNILPRKIKVSNYIEKLAIIVN